MNDITSLIRTKIPLVAPGDRLARIALVMSRTRSNAILVGEGGTLVGCVMRKQLLKPPLSPETKAERLLSHPPILATETTTEDAIALVLQSSCDLLPVVDKGKVRGAILARDLAFQDPALRKLTLNDLINKLVPPIPETISISEAAAFLRNMDMESLPLIGSKGDPASWVSFPDIQRYLVSPQKGVRGTGEFVGEKGRPSRNPVGSIANEMGIRATREMNLHEAIGLLCSKKCNELTVFDGTDVLGHLNILGILALTRPSVDLLIQIAGMEEEDPIEVGQVIGNLKATALKIQEIWKNMGTPEIKVKSYEHRGSKRKRYKVRVAFSVPEQYVAEAEGWNLLAASTQAVKRVERELLRGHAKSIESHRRGRTRPP